MPYTIHEPVLLQEVLSYLDPQPGQNFIDGTFGGGGHALAIMEKIGPAGKLIGIDWDKGALITSQYKNFVLINSNYRHLKKIVHDSGIAQINGILLDLGLSSDQLGRISGGFGFQSEGNLDLRYDSASGRSTAAEILRQSNEEELFKIFREYGEEPLARPLAKTIIAKRQKGEAVMTADMLVQLVESIYRKYFKNRSRRHPATRVFQALRIAVNDELGNLRAVLPQAVEILAPSGRFAVISFHSGEDRIVKNFFREEAKKDNPRIRILTKKPIIPSAEEVKRNPRSRSAKLRVAEKINPPVGG